MPQIAPQSEQNSQWLFKIAKHLENTFWEKLFLSFSQFYFAPLDLVSYHFCFTILRTVIIPSWSTVVKIENVCKIWLSTNLIIALEWGLMFIVHIALLVD